MEQFGDNEDQVKLVLARSSVDATLHRWISLGSGKIFAIKLNWVTSLVAIAFMWGFALISLIDDENASDYFSDGRLFVSQNFTWLYIFTQDVWCILLLYLAFSKYGNLKLGREHEKPRFDDFTWFCMLFTTGIAVGLYVFGVAEPLYYYRQPTSEFAAGFDYATNKLGVENDAMRAIQALTITVYHWGIHGWVPYIMVALACGLVSFRWGMPMSIRACFYPIFGDHVLGILGDVIDAISIATTTFGVCTSLGLGVVQLLSGLQFLADIGCDLEANCVAAGGTWDLNTYGPSSCIGATSPVESCSLSFLADEDSRRTGYIIIILAITVMATISVLSGLDRGIRTLSVIAFVVGLTVMFIISFSDNLWYLLNLMVQTTGYYLQNIIVLGFDCEAFQQLNAEFGRGQNKYWGADESTAASAIAASVGLDVATPSQDCGDQVNPCVKGAIAASLAAALAAGGAQAQVAKDLLLHQRLSPANVERTERAYSLMREAFPSLEPQGVPCGSGWNTTHFDPFTARVFGLTSFDPNAPTAYCAGLNGSSLASCEALWAEFTAGSGDVLPRCPETPFVDVPHWGQCDTHKLECHRSIDYYDDTPPHFMDAWTIFYWAWWITWAPFVGFFVALISRGRTVREVIIGGFICPTIFAIIWFSVFGGLAIKMTRVAELALHVKPDQAHALHACSEHYAGSVPITPEAKRLASAGYYLLDCLPQDDRIYYLMGPYKNLVSLLHVLLWVGLVIYFLTSSDSGSMVDDVLSASGLNPAYVPHWQKVFWAFTEGVVAIALVYGEASLRTLQNASIIMGLPFTIILCFLVPSLWRLLQKEAGVPSATTYRRFNTQLLDVLELFRPRVATPFSAGKQMVHVLIALFLPFMPVLTTWLHLYPDSKLSAATMAVACQALVIGWAAFNLIGIGVDNVWVLGWVMYVFFGFLVSMLRTQMRERYRVWGSWFDDITAGLFFYPFALAQLAMMAESNGVDAPGYWDAAESLITDLALSQKMERKSNGGDIAVEANTIAIELPQAQQVQYSSR